MAAVEKYYFANRSRRNPRRKGNQNVRPRNARVITRATAPGTFKDVYTRVITPSTIPIPWGRGEIFKKRKPMAYPATKAPNWIGCLNAKKKAYRQDTFPRESGRELNLL